MFSVLQRCKAGIFFKFPEKVSEVMESAIQADVHHREIRGLEENDRLLDAIFINIGNRGFSKGFFEKTAEILFIHIGLPCQISYV